MKKLANLSMGGVGSTVRKQPYTHYSLSSKRATVVVKTRLSEMWGKRKDFMLS